MSKKTSIAQDILAELQQKHLGIDPLIKPLVINFMNARLTSRLDRLEKLEEEKFYNFSSDNVSLPINDVNGFLTTAEFLGFICKYSEENQQLEVSFPKREKGKPMSTAQHMLYNYKIQRNKKEKELSKIARAEIDRVWAEIKARNFESVNNGDGTFTIKIKLSEDRGGKYGEAKLIKFLSDRKFHPATISDNELSIIIGK